MARIEKTVFISYRRTDVYTALAVYENLKNQGYDVFFDYRSISSGDFEQIISSNIRARAHFLLILTPTALERCNEPGDWLRREIEIAIDEKRNIVPLFFKGFRFGAPSVSANLTGILSNLSRYNGLNVHEDYFDEAMHRLRTQYLSVPLTTVLHPISTEVRKVVKEEQVAADKALEQIDDIKELVKQAEVKRNAPRGEPVLNAVGIPKEKRVPAPAGRTEGKIEKPVRIPPPHTEEGRSKGSLRLPEQAKLNLRLIGGIVGGLLVITLCIWGGARLWSNMLISRSEPTPPPATEVPTEAATESPATEAPAPAGELFRVAVVMPSAINDLAFSQSMYDALVRVQEEMGAENFEFVYSENLFAVDDAATAIRDYASQGYDLVIANGPQYGSSVQEIAPDVPETSFAWGTTVDTFGLPNVFAYEARSEQGGFVNGVMAATLSQSNVIGVVGPIETGDAKLYVDGFKAGVLSVKPDAQVNVNYIGSFSDVALASEAATTHISAGADVLTGTAQMVVGAIGKAEESDVLWFGTQSNQASLAPSIVVASQVYHWEVTLNEMISKIKSGTLGGESLVIDLANGGEVIEFNPESRVAAEAQTLAEETIQGIIDGTIKIPLP